MAHESMVHALKEIARVLVPGGYLIDLRPFTKTRAVDVLADGGSFPAGYIDYSHEFADDLAANAAVEQVTAEGIFAREEDDSFNLFFYWDTAPGFVTHVEEVSSGVLPPETATQVEALMTQYGPNARIRADLNMIITRYRKL